MDPHLDSGLLAAPLVIAVSVCAETGTAAIVTRQGTSAVAKLVRGSSGVAVADTVAARAAQLRPEALFMDGTTCCSVADRLRQLGHPVLPLRRSREELHAAVAAWRSAGGTIVDDADDGGHALVELQDVVADAVGLGLVVPVGQPRRKVAAERQRRAVDYMWRDAPRQRANRSRWHDPFAGMRSS